MSQHSFSKTWISWHPNMKLRGWCSHTCQNARGHWYPGSRGYFPWDFKAPKMENPEESVCFNVKVIFKFHVCFGGCTFQPAAKCSSNRKGLVLVFFWKKHEILNVYKQKNKYRTPFKVVCTKTPRHCSPWIWPGNPEIAQHLWCHN